MSDPIVLTKRGLKAALPTTGLSPGQQLFTTDRGSLHVATSGTTSLTVVPAIDDLTELSSGLDSTNDLFIVHDASASGRKEKKITLDTMKAALSLTDKYVAVTSTGAASYLGSDGTDGVLRVNSALSMTVDTGGDFTVLGVGTIDQGTFA